jgi:hypothetical protein
MNKTMLLVLLVSFVSCGINATEEVVTNDTTETVVPKVRKEEVISTDAADQAPCTDCGCASSN